MREFRAAAALALMAGLLVACGVLPHREQDCPGGKLTPVSPGVAPRVPATHEALWVADGTGVVRAVDGGRGRVVVGGTDPRLAPVLGGGGGLLWVYRLDAGDLQVVDPGAAKIVRHVAVPVASPLANNLLLYAHGALWIVQPGKLWRVTAKGAAKEYPLPAEFAPGASAVTARWIWLAGSGRLLRIDPADPGTMTETAPADGVGDLAYAGGGLFAAGINSPTVRRLDPDTGALVGSVTLAAGELALSLVSAGEQAWAVGNCGNLVRLGDRLTVRVAEISQDLPTVAAAGSLWVGDEVRSEIVRIDAASGRVLARMPFRAADPDDPVFGFVAGRSTVWILDGDFFGGVSRIDPAAGRVTRVVPARAGTGLISAAVI